MNNANANANANAAGGWWRHWVWVWAWAWAWAWAWQGAANKKQIGDPRGGWVGQRPKKDRVRFIFLIFF
jgi:hypothetical protein